MQNSQNFHYSILFQKSNDLPQVTDKLLSHNVISSTTRLSGIRTHNISGDRH
jgi:hypothetical protein